MRIDELNNLDERVRDYDWVILPATMELYNKRTVTPKEAVAEWGDGTILVCEIVDKQNRVAFVYSGTTSEQGFNQYSAQIGQSFICIHDQSRAYKGRYKLVNVIQFGEDGEIAHKANDVGMNVKASLSVFK